MTNNNKDIKDIIDNLKDLEKDDIESIVEYLEQVKNKKSENNKSQPKKRKGGKRRKSQSTENTNSFDNIDSNSDRPKSSKSRKGGGRRGRSKPRSENAISTIDRRGKGKKSKSGKGKTPARAEPFIPQKRENKFLTMTFKGQKISEQYKNDTKIDRLLWKGKQPSMRRDKAELIEIQCIRCEYYFDVPEVLIMDDPELGPYYICNDCGGQEGGSTG